MNKRWLLVPLLVGAGLLGAIAPGLASSAWQAAQTGSQQWGTATATNLTIVVEGGLDPDGQLLPDAGSAQYCAAGYVVCPGAALSFTIENRSSVPLRVTNVQRHQTTCGSNATPPCYYSILTDKNNDGTWSPYLTYGSTTCADHAYFMAPNFNTFGARLWPVIPPHSTLHVNGHDNLALGAKMFHLDDTTPSACQGASFFVPLTVTAQDAS